MSDFDKVFKILEKNESKDFVQRIFSPELSDSIVNEDGSASTHRMATAEQDGVHYVYPTIQKNDNGYLQEYEGWDAFDRAMIKNEAIGFKTKKEAEWFERHWKLIWNKNHKADY